MKNSFDFSRTSSSTVCGLFLAGILAGAAASAQAQSGTAQAIAASKNRSENPNRIGVSYRFPIGVSVDFKNVGGFAPLGVNVPGAGPQSGNPGAPAGMLENRTYENGYVWADISTNAGGLTWFWGYNNLDDQAQPNPQAPVAIDLQSSSSAQTSIDDRKDDLIAGFELVYARELVRKEKFRAGVEAAFGYNDMEVNTRKTAFADVNRITDSFRLSGLDFSQPLPPSYQGTFEGPTVPGGPGRLVSAEPNRTEIVIPDGAEIEGSRFLGADLFNFRLGPYFEFPLSDEVSFTASAGMSLMYVFSKFRFSETITIPDVGTTERTGASTHSDWVVGGYISGIFSLEFRERWFLFGGAQFQSMGDYTHKAAGKKAVLRMGEAWYLTAGIAHSF